MTTVSPALSVVVVDNHEAVRRGVCAELAARPERFTVAGSAASVEDLDRTGPAPDVVVLDLYLGRDDTPSTPAIAGLRRWGAAVVLYTSEERPAPLRAAIAAGASGLALKNDDVTDLMSTVEVVAAGDFACSSRFAQALLDDDTLLAQLSVREGEVLDLLDDGLTRHQVGTRLGIKDSTVTEHLNRVKEKYQALGRDVPNAHAVLREAEQDGWIRRLLARRRS